MNAGQLKQLIANVPDDFDIGIADLSHSSRCIDTEIGALDFEVDTKEKKFVLPAREQELRIG